MTDLAQRLRRHAETLARLAAAEAEADFNSNAFADKHRRHAETLARLAAAEKVVEAARNIIDVNLGAAVRAFDASEKAYSSEASSEAETWPNPNRGKSPDLNIEIGKRVIKRNRKLLDRLGDLPDVNSVAPEKSEIVSDTSISSKNRDGSENLNISEHKEGER